MATHDVLFVMLDSDADKVAIDRNASPKQLTVAGVPPLTFGVPFREHFSFPNPRAAFQQVLTDAQRSALTPLLASLGIPEGSKTTVYDVVGSDPIGLISPAWRFVVEV